MKANMHIEMQMVTHFIFYPNVKTFMYNYINRNLDSYYFFTFSLHKHVACYC